MLYHEYNIAIDSGVGTPVHVKDVLDGLDSTEKNVFSMLMKTVQLPGAAINNPHMVTYASMSNTYIILES